MKRIPQLDGLRGIAILMVFLYHTLHAPVFWSGVDLFFILSGYLITGILLRLKEQQVAEGGVGWWRAFYVRRVCRILPPYVAFLGIVSLFFRVPWSHTWFWYAFFDANLASATQHDAIKAMVPLWSLAVEEQFYLVWPWVVLLGSRRTLKNVALGIIVAAPVLRALCTPAFASYWPIYCLTPFRADTLACGAFIAIGAYEDATWIDRHHYRAALCAMVAGVIFTTLSISPSFRLSANNMLFNTLAYSLLVVIFGGTVFYLLGSQAGLVSAIASTKPLRYLGLISYTFYLYHFGVWILLEQRVHTAILACLLSFAITGAIAALSWRFFESPILRISRALESPHFSTFLGGAFQPLTENRQR